MKFNWDAFDKAAQKREAEVTRDIHRKYGQHPEANFFDLGSGDASVATFVSGCHERGLSDPVVIDRLVDAMLSKTLHPLQTVRISRLLNDPSEELEDEDRTLLIAQVLDLAWAKNLLKPETEAN